MKKRVTNDDCDYDFRQVDKVTNLVVEDGSVSSRINPRIREAISRLAIEAAGTSGSSVIQETAQATKALPVHADMSGVLALTPDGDVIQYDPETGAKCVPEENW